MVHLELLLFLLADDHDPTRVSPVDLLLDLGELT